jgi:hypothetical protein
MEMGGPARPSLADELVAFVVASLEALERAHLPGFRVPRVFGGHLVAPDTWADLAFTLSHLERCGVETVAGRPVRDAILSVLHSIDGAGTHTFFSYRVAETLARLGGLDVADEADRTNLAVACDSTGHLELLADGRLPPNYAAVLLRCELGRRALGLDVDDEVVDDLVERLTRFLDRPGGYLDDSSNGGGRFDIYTVDVYLFTAPFADVLGAVWERGARAAVRLVERVGATNGAAVHWGRSTGALAACHTVELAALVADRSFSDDVPAWIGRGENALAHFRPWISEAGLITAHQHRSTYGYRGPYRRLQMTLDCLGKLADAAAVLRGVPAVDPVVERDRLFPPIDELVDFDAPRHAGVWTYRSRDLAFVLPIVGSTVNDYLPAPHNPGLFEVPVEADLPTGLPIVFSGGKRFTSGGLPVSVNKLEGGLALRYEGFPASQQFDLTDATPVVAGHRSVSYQVAGRTLRVDETLTFEEPPQALAVQITETKGRPLKVSFECDVPHTVTTIDVAGLKEHRSFWAELDRVHQIDVEPAAAVSLGWTVKPVLRVLSTARDHVYQTSVLDPLVRSGDVVVGQALLDRMLRAGRLGGWDQLHLHWPEWSFGDVDAAWHEWAVAGLGEAGVRIVWTQHNLVPHDKDPRHVEAYAVWAAAADGVIHHSEHGRRLVTERYPFRDDAIHRVIPHPHFGHMHGPPVARPDDGLIRLGVVGAPRVEKDVQLVMDAVAASDRADIRLEVYCLGPSDVAPADARITAVPFERVGWEIHGPRLGRLDALVLPFAPEGMLTTGTVGDAIGAGLPALVSPWPFLAEALGEAAIPYGSTRDDLVATLAGLDRARLAEAAAASKARQARCSSEVVAAMHLELLEAVGTTRL